MTILALPFEIWELILDFLALDENPSSLFTFYQINAMTRAVLSNPNHKYWVRAVHRIPIPEFIRQQRVHASWCDDRMNLARKCLRVALFDKCMMCDACAGTKFYWNFAKRLCQQCSFRYTIDEMSVRHYYGFRNIYRHLPHEVIFGLPALNPTGKNKRRFHYFHRDFTRLLGDQDYIPESYDFRDRTNTPAVYNKIKEDYLKTMQNNQYDLSDLLGAMRL